VPARHPQGRCRVLPEELTGGIGQAARARHLGNIPRAFSHLALVTAVMHLIRDDERRSAGTSI
jgi:hypothetical protein